MTDKTTVSQSVSVPVPERPVVVQPEVAVALKDLLGPQTLVGCAIDGVLPESLEPMEIDLLSRHFTSITAENCMKPLFIQPEEGVFTFQEADALVQFARRHNLKVIGHTLVWHQQCPAWFFQNGPSTASRELILRRMQRHIETVVRRYRGLVQGWDVVNEAVADNGEYLRKSPWLELVGEDFVAKAFEYAWQADPDVELYYNDFNIEQPEKRQRAVRLIKDLKARGLRVDAVGIQGHWLLDRVPFQDLEETIRIFADLGLKVMITELDLDVVDRPDCGADISAHRAYTLQEDIYRDGCPPEILERQAQQYARLFEIVHRYRQHVSRVTFWGLHDGRSWLNYWPGRRTNYPLLFDRYCRPKPAFIAVVRSLMRR